MSTDKPKSWPEADLARGMMERFPDQVIEMRSVRLSLTTRQIFSRPMLARFWMGPAANDPAVAP